MPEPLDYRPLRPHLATLAIIAWSAAIQLSAYVGFAGYRYYQSGRLPRAWTILIVPVVIYAAILGFVAWKPSRTAALIVLGLFDGLVATVLSLVFALVVAQQRMDLIGGAAIVLLVSAILVRIVFVARALLVRPALPGDVSR